jgi:hypothetical protein
LRRIRPVDRGLIDFARGSSVFPHACESFEPDVTDRLEKAGFKVVPSEIWTADWKRTAAEAGGLYDPTTGEADQGRVRLVHAQVRRELAREYLVDAVLNLTVEIVDLNLTTGTPIFCGTRDRVFFPMARRQSRVLDHRGVLAARAACLSVSLRDIQDRELYAARFGIEAWQTYARQTRATRPRALRLRNIERIQEAIRETVGPLAKNAARTD